MTDEQLDKIYADKCDFRNGTNEDGIYYAFCNQCYRYEICKSADENHVCVGFSKTS